MCPESVQLPQSFSRVISSLYFSTFCPETEVNRPFLSWSYNSMFLSTPKMTGGNVSLLSQSGQRPRDLQLVSSTSCCETLWLHGGQSNSQLPCPSTPSSVRQGTRGCNQNVGGQFPLQLLGCSGLIQGNSAAELRRLKSTPRVFF